jgi:hypothetical protein
VRDAPGMSFDCQLFDKIGIIASELYFGHEAFLLLLLLPPYKYNYVVHYLFHISSIMSGGHAKSGIALWRLSSSKQGRQKRVQLSQETLERSRRAPASHADTDGAQCHHCGLSSLSNRSTHRDFMDYDRLLELEQGRTESTPLPGFRS